MDSNIIPNQSLIDLVMAAIALIWTIVQHYQHKGTVEQLKALGVQPQLNLLTRIFKAVNAEVKNDKTANAKTPSTNVIGITQK